MGQFGASAFLPTENYTLLVVKMVQLRCGRIALVLSDCGEQRTREVIIDTAQTQRTCCTIRIETSSALCVEKNTLHFSPEV